GELHPKIRWTKRGLSLADGSDRIVEIGERGFLLMPSAYLWPHAAAVIEQPWLPAIIYPAVGIARLWQASATPPEVLGRLLLPARGLPPALAALRAAPGGPGPAARPSPSPPAGLLGSAHVHDRARRDHRAQPGRRLGPPAHAPQRRPPLHRPARPRGPLLPHR